MEKILPLLLMLALVGCKSPGRGLAVDVPPDATRFIVRNATGIPLSKCKLSGHIIYLGEFIELGTTKYRLIQPGEEIASRYIYKKGLEEVYFECRSKQTNVFGFWSAILEVDSSITPE